VCRASDEARTRSFTGGPGIGRNGRLGPEVQREKLTFPPGRW
jgi:hypothetical protein